MAPAALKKLQAHQTAIRRWEPQVQALIGWDEVQSRRNLEAAGSGPLEGWAIGVKDIIDLRGQPTGCNAPFISFPPASENAAVVQNLIDLGAFVLSKTVTTTFAFFDPGPTRNPWNLNHTPGGSSSGSAAAVACGMVRLALGSQTVASVNRPASFCGIVGFKPTYGMLPMAGVFPFAPSVDTLGFFTKRVSDAQQVFTSMTGPPDTFEKNPIRVGVVENPYVDPAQEEMLAMLRKAALELEASGLEVRSVELPPACRAAQQHHWSLVAAEAAVSHREIFAEYRNVYPPKLKELILRGQAIPASQMETIHAHRSSLQAELEDFLASFDLLITPSAPGAAPKGIDTTGDPRFSLLWTYTGFPTLTLPAQLSQDGLPLGIQLVGRPQQDHPLLAAGLVIEKVLSFPTLPDRIAGGAAAGR